MNEKPESLVVRHVGDIYRNANSGKGQSWRILNGALDKALTNCITAHLTFQPDDFDTIYSKFNGGYWFGTNGNGKGHGEGFYSLAVDCGNMSACLAFEKWAGFAPYLYLGRRLAVAGVPYNSIAGEVYILKGPAIDSLSFASEKTTENDVLRAIFNTRLARRWWVTAIGKESIRLANYDRADNAGAHRDGKPTSLMELTHDQLDSMSREIRADIKAAKPKKEKANP